MNTVCLRAEAETPVSARQYSQAHVYCVTVFQRYGCDSKNASACVRSSRRQGAVYHIWEEGNLVKADLFNYDNCLFCSRIPLYDGIGIDQLPVLMCGRECWI